MNLRRDIKKSIKEAIKKVVNENSMPISVLRRLRMSEKDIINYLKKFAIKNFSEHRTIEVIIGKSCGDTAYEILDLTHTSIDDETFNKLRAEVRNFLFEKYGEMLKSYIRNFFNESGDKLDTRYSFHKHSERDVNSRIGTGFSQSFYNWNGLLREFGSWFPNLDWADIKDTLDSMPDRRPLLIVTPDDKFNGTGYYFSLSKNKIT